MTAIFTRTIKITRTGQVSIFKRDFVSIICTFYRDLKGIKMKTFAFPPTAALWARFVRLPNLFTVPGDILVGSCFAGLQDRALLLFLVPAALCLYSAGIIANDIFDVEEDRLHDLPRPLVTGAISASSAKTALVILLAVALGLSAFCGTSSFIAATVLACLIWCYTTTARKIPPAGFVVMGLLRGANVLLGASPWLHTSRGARS